MILLWHFDMSPSFQMKELRHFLSERGEDCKGCAEKDDFAAAAFQIQDFPLKETIGSSNGDEKAEKKKSKFSKKDTGNDFMDDNGEFNDVGN